MKNDRPAVHPLVVRVTHWVNALCVIVMILSGLAIHNAYPTLPFTIPPALTLGGGLIGGLRWHFAAMWLLVLNGLVYLVYGLASGRFARKLWPISPRAVVTDLRAFVAGRLSHDDIGRYNAVQRLLYAGVILALVFAVASGLAIWKPVQLRGLVMALGDFDRARLLHFWAMAAIVLFLLVHVTMALAVPRSLGAMIRGR
ncbi:cytochrome b/b6 domain-containing protein [Chelatococcus sp. SYSU_G07232]|uniref:Cytochrome b/b6 domain-containing protein n=1 Tax=Chelatococcus albus TaxID=3047466 RepID=A0ABT7AJG5_9HYPH|nr:cytochrome b/b6 domain-containing protein [Chelatococcus sp. SYSU_G07232]MDJ1159499.1 cytochrome b/b6 domain-containing protein [Chelatococcus sp. SYSU_G07232]